MEKKIYFNGFSIVIGPPDIIIILKHNNQQTAVLNASHTVAKTLATSLLSVIEDFEERSKQDILTLDEIKSKLDQTNA